MIAKKRQLYYYISLVDKISCCGTKHAVEKKIRLIYQSMQNSKVFELN